MGEIEHKHIWNAMVRPLPVEVFIGPVDIRV